MSDSKHICEECTRTTGGCCTDLEITLHVKEAGPFVQRMKDGTMPEMHTLIMDDDEDSYTYETHETNCMFLIDNRCSIYEERPTICRTYPVQWTKRAGVMEYLADCTCPLTHRLPIAELTKWMDTLPHPEYLEEIGELDVDPKSTTYINLTVIGSKISEKFLLDPSLVV